MRSLHLLLPLTVVGSALAGPLIAEIDDSHLEKEFAINNLETTLHMFNEFDSQSLRCGPDNFVDPYTDQMVSCRHVFVKPYEWNECENPVTGSARFASMVDRDVAAERDGEELSFNLDIKRITDTGESYVAGTPVHVRCNRKSIEIPSADCTANEMFLAFSEGSHPVA